MFQMGNYKIGKNMLLSSQKNRYFSFIINRAPSPHVNDGGTPGMKDLKSNEKVTSPTQSHNSEKNLTEAELQVSAFI